MFGCITSCCLSTIVGFLGIAALVYVLVDRFIGRTLIPNIITKYVLITGCDSGFGEHACVRFDRAGCHVIAACLTPEGVTRIQGKCSSRLKAIQMDVTDEKSIQDAVKIVEAHLPANEGLWGIINNAGVLGRLGPIEWFNKEDILNVFNINALGEFNVIHAFLPLLKKSPDGARIVNMSSVLGLRSLPFAASYSISKYAIEVMSDALRIELQPYNIRVSIIEPGAHRTAFLAGTEESINSTWDRLPEATKEQFGTDYWQQVLFFATLVAILSSSSPDPVIDAYQHALFSVRPRRRYIVGIDAMLLVVISYLPSAVHDFIFLFPGLRAVPKSCK